MTNPSEPRSCDLRLLFDLVVHLPNDIWNGLRAYFHGRIAQGAPWDAGHIEELIRKMSAARAEGLSDAELQYLQVLIGQLSDGELDEVRELVQSRLTALRST